MESLEQLSDAEVATYQQLLALPLALLHRPAGADGLPELPLPHERRVMIGELLLDVQQALTPSC